MADRSGRSRPARLFSGGRRPRASASSAPAHTTSTTRGRRSHHVYQELSAAELRMTCRHGLSWLCSPPLPDATAGLGPGPGSERPEAATAVLRGLTAAPRYRRNGRTLPLWLDCRWTATLVGLGRRLVRCRCVVQTCVPYDQCSVVFVSPPSSVRVNVWLVGECVVRVSVRVASVESRTLPPRLRHRSRRRRSTALCCGDADGRVSGSQSARQHCVFPETCEWRCRDVSSAGGKTLPDRHLVVAGGPLKRVA